MIYLGHCLRTGLWVAIPFELHIGPSRVTCIVRGVLPWSIVIHLPVCIRIKIPNENCNFAPQVVNVEL